jgi:tetratricopeptide (TPR) repeat protein
MRLFLLQGAERMHIFDIMYDFRRFFFLSTLAICSSFALAESNAPKPSWQEAQEQFKNARFADALKTLEATPANEALYFYNLGTTHLKLGQVGKAVAYLEKARRIHPNDSDITYNLLLARKELSKRIGDGRLDAASSWLETLPQQIPLEEAQASVGLLAFIFIIFWFYTYLQTHKFKKSLARPTGLLAVLALGITIVTYGVQQFADLSPTAVCLESQVIRSGPGEHFLELAHVEPGMKVRLTESTATPEAAKNWQQVRYANGQVGWIHASSLLLL